MNPTARLRRIGQSLWLNNITRDLLDSGTLAPYIADLSVTADHGTIGEALGRDVSAAAADLARFADAGVDVDALGNELQVKGAQAFVTSWNSLLGRIEAKVGEIVPGD